MKSLLDKWINFEITPGSCFADVSYDWMNGGARKAVPTKFGKWFVGKSQALFYATYLIIILVWLVLMISSLPLIYALEFYNFVCIKKEDY